MISSDKTRIPGEAVTSKWSAFLRTPLGVAAAIWGGMLLLYFLPILDYPGLSGNFELAIGLAGAGAVLGDIAARLRTRRNAGSGSRTLQLNTPLLKRQWRLGLFLGLFGICIIYTDLFSRISLSTFVQQQNTVKSYLDRNLLGQFLAMFLYLALMLGTILRFAARSSWWYVVAPILLVVLYSMSFWGKLPFLIGLFLVAAVRSCIRASSRASPRARRRRWPWWVRIPGLAAGSIALFSILSWSMELRLAEFGAGYDLNIGVARRDVIDWLEERRLFLGSGRSAIVIYSYATNPLLGLDFYVSQPSPQFLGELTLGYLGRMLHRLDLLEGEAPDPYKVGRYEGLSVQLPTLLGYGFIDFSWLGVFGYPFLLIYGASVRYRRLIERPADYRIVPLAMYYLIILCSPWTCLVASTEYAFLFAVAISMGGHAVTARRLGGREVNWGAAALEPGGMPNGKSE